MATLIAYFGIWIAPLGRRLTLFVCGHALAWFLAADPVKLLADRIPPASGSTTHHRADEHASKGAKNDDRLKRIPGDRRQGCRSRQMADKGQAGLQIKG
jgi:hypothetical protein